jgi:hypothetical protein
MLVMSSSGITETRWVDAWHALSRLNGGVTETCRVNRRRPTLEQVTGRVTETRWMDARCPALEHGHRPSHGDTPS